MNALFSSQHHSSEANNVNVETLNTAEDAMESVENTDANERADADGEGVKTVY